MFKIAFFLYQIMLKKCKPQPICWRLFLRDHIAQKSLITDIRYATEEIVQLSGRQSSCTLHMRPLEMH